MNTAIIIAAIAAIASLLTSIASFIMVLEMRKQRKAISTPVLKILSKNSYHCSREINHWKWEGEDPYRLRLSLFNYGTGPAINVSINWELDEEDFINTIKQFVLDSQMSLGFKKESGFMHLGDSGHNVEIQRTQKIEAVPVSIDRYKTTIAIPSYYIAGFGKYMDYLFAMLPNDKFKLDTMLFPPIFTTVNYEDINGDKIKQRFNILLEIGMLGPDDNKNNSALVIFKISEVKE